MADEPRYFLRASPDATSKGPFDLASLRASRKRGLVTDAGVVQREDGTEWVPIKTLFAKEDEDAKRKAFVESPKKVVQPEQGNMGLGIAAGFFGGVIGMVLVLAMAKGTETKRGAVFGFAMQAFVWIMLRLALTSAPPQGPLR